MTAPGNCPLLTECQALLVGAMEEISRLNNDVRELLEEIAAADPNSERTGQEHVEPIDERRCLLLDEPDESTPPTLCLHPPLVEVRSTAGVWEPACARHAQHFISTPEYLRPLGGAQ